MATRAGLVKRVREKIGELKAARFSENELHNYMIDDIRDLQDAVNYGALIRMLLDKTGVGSSGGVIPLLDTVRKITRLLVKEPDFDGDYKSAWEEVTQEERDKVKNDEGNLAMSATPTRIFSVEANSDNELWSIITYPEITSADFFKYSYIPKATDEGSDSIEMTIPSIPSLQQLLVIRVSAIAMRKKGHDLVTAARFQEEADKRLAVINARYSNEMFAR